MNNPNDININYSNDELIPFTNISDLKYQRLKTFKNIVTQNNKYNITAENPEILRIKKKDQVIQNSPHKNDLQKIDCPYNLKKNKRNNKEQLKQEQKLGK